MNAGAFYLGNNRCEFVVWSPAAKQVAVKIVSPVEKLLPMKPIKMGYWQVVVDALPPGSRYFYQLEDGSVLPDPASNFQPEGVHGPSEVVDHQAFSWSDASWNGIPLKEMILYELHVGTFTPEGTFEAIIPRLKTLRDLGINAIEIMPIAQFPGRRNWGYDGTYVFAVQNSYGGVEGLKKLVDAAHQQGISVTLDVVYNHFGPEGNYIGRYGPYFTEKYMSPWGSGINFDGPYSYGVRDFFIQNALFWFEHYRIDALRLDATDNIFDFSARPFLQELAETVNNFSQQQDRPFYLVAENDLNDKRLVTEVAAGGYGLHGQWNDGFHHCVHTLLTGEQIGYYEDYGTCELLAKAYKKTFVYSGEYSPYRKKWHGSDVSDRPGDQFVVFVQNHDQVGNRMLGERLSHLVSFDALKLAAATIFVAPNIPLMFMGEEYAEDAPFLYFVDHNDLDLIQAVREGRRREFEAFHLEGEYVDPASEEALQRSQLHWEKREQGNHKVMLDFYRYLIQLRRTIPALKVLSKDDLAVAYNEDDKLLFLHRWHGNSQIICLMNFNASAVTAQPDFPAGEWHKILDSAEAKWLGDGSELPEQLQSGRSITMKPHSVALYQQS